MKAKENIIRTIRRDNPEWIPYRYDGGLTMLLPQVVSCPKAGGLDDWGVHWLRAPAEESSYPEGRPVLTIDEVDEFEAPEANWERVTTELRQQVVRLSAEDTLIIAKNELTLFDRVRLLLGTEEFMMAIVLYPEQLHALFDKVMVYQRQLTRAVVSSGVAGIRFTDDWGMQESLWIRPEQWRAFVRPRLGELYGIVKQGGSFVFQHSCGHIEEILPDLIELGLDVIDPCQPRSNDIFRWKREYGHHLSFMGGLDTQGYLSLGTPEEVKSAVKEVVSVMGRGGGYIAAPSHTIRLPETNERAMMEAIQQVNASTL